MVFSSPIFLFLFLPITLIGNFIFRKNLCNLFLLAMSLVFYAWGEPKFVFVMIGVVLLDYLFGLWVDHAKKYGRSTRLPIVLTVIVNVGLLFIFKYLNFTTQNLHVMIGDRIPVTQIALPIGISFFTFQAMSYVFDVNAGKGRVQRNPLNVLLYVSLFPQLIAGPIVRYQTVADEINDRKVTLDDFSYGIQRFIIGLAKKAILANTLGISVDYCYDLVGTDALTTGLAWLAAIGYSLQLYYDFSGYSDMAIGLGRMLGFHFLENFDYPYMAKSVGEFWRRWHISMGTWFRDYVYIPLGGSRSGKVSRVIFNLFVVWLLTGIWHGANWTFIVWGLWHFLWIALERVTNIPKRCGKIGGAVYRVITLLVVVLGWVLFRSDNLGSAWIMVQAMFDVTTNSNAAYIGTTAWAYFPFYIVALVLCFPWKNFLAEKIRNSTTMMVARYIGCICIFAVSIVFVVAGTYNAFIYFNF